MKFIRLAIVTIISFCNISFTTIEGKDISMEEILGSSNKELLFIFSSNPSCQDCYYWIAERIKRLQKKIDIQVYIISPFKENVFERKMSSMDTKRKMRIDIKEIYIYDEKDNPFFLKYNTYRFPCLLYINKWKEQYIPYSSLFNKNGLIKNVIDDIFKH